MKQEKIDLEAMFDRVYPLVKREGDRALQAFGKIKTDVKADGTLVTAIDREVEGRLRADLEPLFPDHGIFGEEGGSTGRSDGEYCWFIDPIDGTVNYASGLAYWAISVGLVHSGVPVFGLIYLPVPDQLFSAILNKGSYLNGKRITSTPKDRMEKEDLFALSSYSPKQFEFLMPQRFRIFGSATAQIVSVSMGVFVGYLLDNWYPWDVAAGLVIAREANVEISCLDGRAYDEPLQPLKEKGPPILFSAPGLTKKLLSGIIPKKKTSDRPI
jgi:myo-inositol-1(or 4)-monophosphatase